MRWLAWLLVAMAAFGQSADLKERALGQSLASDFERQSKILNDAAITEYVRKLAGTLTANAGSTLSLEVKVVDSPERSAAAFPGGFLYVSTGLIVGAKSEVEFARLVAHQIAHIVSSRESRVISQGPPLAVVFMGGSSGLCTRASHVLIPSKNRAEASEREADRLAALYTAGFRDNGAEFERVRDSIPVRRPPSLRDSN